MKVVVYGSGKAPSSIRKVQTAQVEVTEELFGLMRDLAGGEFVLAILTTAAECVALRAARTALPHPKVVLAQGERLREVVSPGVYRPYTRIA